MCSPSLSEGVWHVDSGAGMSITGDRSLFTVFDVPLNLPSVRFGDGVVQRAVGKGSIELCSDWLPTPIILTNVLYIPHCPVNLLSVNAVAHSLHCKISFDSISCTATQGSSILWSFPASGDGVYKFACRPCYTTSGCSFGADNYPAFALDVDEDGGVVIPTTPEWLWHRRLGHPGYDAMHRLVKKGMVKNLPLSLNQVQKLAKIPCDACQKAKGKRLPFPKASTTPINAPLQRLHLDIMGPVHIRGLRGEFYILCLTDQHSGYAEVLCLRTRDEAPLAVQTIILRWMNQLHGFAFKCLRSDRAKEFIVKWFEDWLISVGAVHELSLAYTAQQNATVERYNGVLQSIARSIHLESKLTKSFWPYAFLAACYLRNRLPNQGDKTPHELFFGVQPDVSMLRVFGCPCYVTLVNGKKRNKLDERALSGRLVGYSLVSKGSYIWVPMLRQLVESSEVLSISS